MGWAWSWGYNVRWLRLNHVMCWEALQVAALEQEAGATSFSFQFRCQFLANIGHALGGLYIEKLVS